MRVLVADKFETIGLEGLESLGCEVLYEPDLKGEALGNSLRENKAEVLVVRSTEVPEAAMQDTQLALIIRAGAGVNTIDVQAQKDLFGVQLGGSLELHVEPRAWLNFEAKGLMLYNDADQA